MYPSHHHCQLFVQQFKDDPQYWPARAILLIVRSVRMTRLSDDGYCEWDDPC